MGCVPVRRLACALVLFACGDGGGATQADPATTTGTSGITLATDAPPTTGATTTTAEATDGLTDGATGTTGEPPPPTTYCGQIDVSLAIDPDLDVFDAATRAAFAAFFTDLVEQTGARVRVVPNVGTEMQVTTDCLLALGNAEDDPILVFGEAGAVDPAAVDALDCSLDALAAYQSDFDAGDWLFSGVLFPVMQLDDWPAPGATGLAIAAAVDDEAQNNMYAQPGTAAEAYLRLVGDGDRRRVAALTYGDYAGRLEIFGIAVSANSRHFERSETPFSEALAAWTPLAVQTCDDFDFEPPFDPEPPAGCERIDVLFAIDGSFSMKGEQDALRGVDNMPPVFAEFTDALLTELTDVEDFRVGVVSSEEGHTELHTHTNYPATPEGPGTACGVPAGQRWLVGPSPTFAEQFACIAATASADDAEVTVYNLAQSLHDPMNAGFLRDDSLVLAVVLTDEDTDDGHLARMVEIRQKLVDAVGGDEDRLIVLAIAGGMGTFEAPKTTCQGVYGGASPGRRVASIVRSFRERGLFQNLCEGDLPATFVAILDDVVSACAAYEPVG
jgi:hypothetical protein